MLNFGRIRQSKMGVQIDSLKVSTMFGPLLAKGIIDENPSHRLRGRREEMRPRIPLLSLLHVDQPYVRFMHQRRGLERLPRPFLGHFLGGQLAEFVVHEGQKLLGGRRITVIDLRQNACNIGHGRYPPAPIRPSVILSRCLAHTATLSPGESSRAGSPMGSSESRFIRICAGVATD